MPDWIRYHRCSLQNAMFRNPKLWHFWQYCLLKAEEEANISVEGYQQVPLKPGEFIFKRKTAVAETGLSDRNIRTCLATLRAKSNISVKSTNKYSIITVINWDTYQNENHSADQQTTNKRPTNDQQKPKKKTPKKPAKKNYIKPKLGKAKNVRLTNDELAKLRVEFGNQGAGDRIDNLSTYIGSKGDKYLSHYLTILNWERMNKGKEGKTTGRHHEFPKCGKCGTQVTGMRIKKGVGCNYCKPEEVD